MAAALASVTKAMRARRDAYRARIIRVSSMQARISDEAERKGLDLELTRSELQAILQRVQGSEPELYAWLRDQAEEKQRTEAHHGSADA